MQTAAAEAAREAEQVTALLAGPTEHDATPREQRNAARAERSARKADQQQQRRADRHARKEAKRATVPDELVETPARSDDVSRSNDRVRVGLVVLSALALLGSVALAIAALLAALEIGSDAAQTRNDLIVRGTASMALLAVGLVVGSWGRSRED